MDTFGSMGNLAYGFTRQAGEVSGITTSLDPNDWSPSYAIADTMSFADDRFLLTIGARQQSLEGETFDYNTGERLSKYDESKLTPVGGIVYKPGETISLAGNRMRVAEVEFAFRIGRTLAPRDTPYRSGEVLDAIDALPAPIAAFNLSTVVLSTPGVSIAVIIFAIYNLFAVVSPAPLNL